MKTRQTMIKVLDQARRIEHDIANTYTHDTTDDDNDGPTCGRTTTAALRPNSPTTSSHSHLRPFLSSSTSHNRGRTDSMRVHGQVSMGMSYHRAQSLVNRSNHTVEIYSQLGGGFLRLELVVSKESHLCWRVGVLRLSPRRRLSHSPLRTWNQLFTHREQIFGRSQPFRTDRCTDNG
jgi:hypothetical protein